LERCARTPYRAEICDLRRPFEILGCDTQEIAEDRRHRVVDPDIDRSELAFDALGRGLYLPLISHIRLDHERAAAFPLDVASRTFEPVNTTGEQRNLPSAFSERDRRRPADAGRSACHDSNALCCLRARHSYDVVAM
jgi:hypothetical protein